MEHKIGTRIILEVVEGKDYSCEECFFNDVKDGCLRPFDGACGKEVRSDGKNIIYREVRK